MISPHIALVVVDMQEEFLPGQASLSPALSDGVEIIGHVAGLFRRAGAPIVWVHDTESCAPGQPGYELAAGLHAEPKDVRVDKVRANAFANGELVGALARHACHAVLVCGYAAEGCVLATVHGAQSLGIDVFALRGGLLSHQGLAATVESLVPVVSHEAVGPLLAGHSRRRPLSGEAPVITPMSASDLPAYADHMERHERENGRDGDVIFMPFGESRRFDRDDFMSRRRQRLGDALTADAWERAWAVRDGERIVGHVDVVGTGFSPLAHRASLGMGLERAWRGRGIGRRLVRLALDWAREQQGLDWIDLGVFAANAPARSLYRSEGFLELGTTPDRCRVDGVAIPDVAMTRWVGDSPGPPP